MSEREEVLREFQRTSKSVMGEPTASFVDRDAMADEIVRLRSALTTAERERDEARRERDEWRDKWAVSAEFNAVHQNRAERAERVVEAAKAWVGDDVDAGYKLWEAVRALDAAEG